MRNCQICLHNGKKVIQNKYGQFCLFECTRCGHRYVDALKLHQGWFDYYYLMEYKTDDKPYSDARLNALADFVALWSGMVLDIGGLDGELQSRLKSRGIQVAVAGVGDYYPSSDCVVLSHTLEHVYDVDAFLDMITCRLLVIEIPIHFGYVAPQEYDYHWQHVNKFSPIDIESLLRRKGYSVKVSEHIEDYRGYQVWRIAGEK